MREIPGWRISHRGARRRAFGAVARRSADVSSVMRSSTARTSPTQPENACGSPPPATPALRVPCRRCAVRGGCCGSGRQDSSVGHTAATGNVTALTKNTATLGGTVNPGGAITGASFQLTIDPGRSRRPRSRSRPGSRARDVQAQRNRQEAAQGQAQAHGHRSDHPHVGGQRSVGDPSSRRVARTQGSALLIRHSRPHRGAFS
jgi:hypothetical protein